MTMAHAENRAAFLLAGKCGSIRASLRDRKVLYQALLSRCDGTRIVSSPRTSWARTTSIRRILRRQRVDERAVGVRRGRSKPDRRRGISLVERVGLASQFLSSRSRPAFVNDRRDDPDSARAHYQQFPGVLGDLSTCSGQRRPVRPKYTFSQRGCDRSSKPGSPHERLKTRGRDDRGHLHKHPLPFSRFG